MAIAILFSHVKKFPLIDWLTRLAWCKRIIQRFVWRVVNVSVRKSVRSDTSSADQKVNKYAPPFFSISCSPYYGTSSSVYFLPLIWLALVSESEHHLMIAATLPFRTRHRSEFVLSSKCRLPFSR